MTYGNTARLNASNNPWANTAGQIERWRKCRGMVGKFALQPLDAGSDLMGKLEVRFAAKNEPATLGAALQFSRGRDEA